MLDVIIVEPLARSTGHQSWFSGNLAEAVAKAGNPPGIVTFDGMHDDNDLALESHGCRVYRTAPSWPAWTRWILVKVTGVRLGGAARPSDVARPYQMHLYNLAATAFSVLHACRVASREKTPVIHLLCPPSTLVMACVGLALPSTTRLAVTTFVQAKLFQGHLPRLRRLCGRGSMTVIVQTEALAADWGDAVGTKSVNMIPLPADEPISAGGCRENRRLLNLPDDKPIVAVIGCIAPAKGYIELFQALRTMPRNFRVLLIGDTGNWMVPRPEDIVAEAGWEEDTIIRKEFVPENLMPHLFGAVDIVALLYREAHGSSGILSLCQRYGVPVLATDQGDIGAKVTSQQLGLTANPKDPDAIRRALRQLLDMPRRESRPRQENSDRATPSWAQIGAAHVRVYQELQHQVGNAQ